MSAGLFVDVPFERKMERRVRVAWDDEAQLTTQERLVAERTEIVFMTWDPLAWTGDADVDHVLLIGPEEDGTQTMMFAGTSLVRFIDPQPHREFSAHAERLVRSAARRTAAAQTRDMQAYLAEIVSGTEGIPAEWQPTWPPATVVSDSGWQPMTIDTVTDYVIEQTGLEPFDPPTIRLDPVDAPVESCPSCRGLTLRLTYELDEARADMCPPHRVAANAHLARLVPEDDDQAWAVDVFNETLGRRLGQPHLPAPLRERVDDLMFGDQSTGEQVETYLALIDLAGDRGGLEPLLDDSGWDEYSAEEAVETFQTSSGELAFQLARDGDFDEAGRFIDRLAAFDPAAGAALHAQFASQAAHAERSAIARQRIAAAEAAPRTEQWPNLLIADAEAELGETVSAAARLRQVRDAAREEGDPHIERESLAQLRDVLRDVDDPAVAAELDAVTREADALTKRLYPVPDDPEPASREAVPHEFGRKVGRNEPCPCGSDKKYKKCHGA